MNQSAVPEQPEYLEAWSLRRHPFEQRLDPQFFYAGAALMQRLDLLTHLVQFGESIVVVSGPPGSGKSSLLKQFLDHLNPQWAVCVLDGEQASQLPDRLAETVGGNPDDGEQALLTRWATQSDTSQHLLLVIDNAEQLDESACQRLCELAGLPDSERVRIVLFGTADTQQHMRETLERLASKRTCQMLEIPRLTEEETASYLMYRLAVAGYSGESPFTPTEIRAICKAADGRPGEINRLAHKTLSEHHARAKNKKHAPLKPGAKRNTAPIWIGASVAIAAVAGYLGWQRLTPPIDAPHHTAEPAQALTELPLALPATPPSIDEAGEDAAPQVEQPSSVSGQATDAIASRTEETGDPEPEKTTAADTTDAAEPAIENTPETPTATPPEDNAAPAETTAMTDGADTETRPSPADGQTVTSSVVTEAPALTENTATTTPPAQRPPASAPGQPHREDWLLQQQPGAFTLQLLGSRDEASIASYIRRYALQPEKTAWYRGRYRDDDWYVLLYGIYPDKPTALAARSALPDELQKGKPWPRSLKSVQDSIREAR